MEGARLTADMRSVTESSSSQAALCSQTLIIVMLTRHRQPRPAPRTTNQQPLQNVNRKSCSEQDQVKWSSNVAAADGCQCGLETLGTYSFERRFAEDFTITEKAPTTFKTLLRHYAKQAPKQGK